MIHITRYMKAFSEEERIRVMEWPACSTVLKMLGGWLARPVYEVADSCSVLLVN